MAAVGQASRWVTRCSPIGRKPIVLLNKYASMREALIHNGDALCDEKAHDENSTADKKVGADRLLSAIQ